jgi:hypothetical protein
MLCILYVNAVGLLLGLAAILIERALPPTAPRRWIWGAVIPIGIAVPGYYRYHHAVSVTDVQQAMQQPLGHAFGMQSILSLDPAWWTHIESYDTSINRLWITMSVMLILWGLVSALRVARVVSVSRRERGNAGGPAIVDGVPVVVTDSIGPATVGLLRSRVLVPRWVLALPGVQRKYVLRHEDEHRRAYDAHLLFIASLPLILMPWNLAMWWLVRRLCLAVEMDCDNRVVSGLGDAPAYGELLLKVAQASSRGPRLQPAFLGGMGTLERRLTVLLAPTPLRHAQRFLLPALALGLLAIVLLMPHPVIAHGTHNMTSGTTTAASGFASRALPR